MIKGKNGYVVILCGRRKFQNENIIELHYNKIMTKREKAVIDKIIDKIITSEVLVKGTDYKFSSSVVTRNIIVGEEDEPNTENVNEIRIDNLFSEGSKIRGVMITMQTNHFTVETSENVDGYWRYIKSSEHNIFFPKQFAQRLYDYVEENKYLILEHNKQQGNGFGFDADELV